MSHYPSSSSVFSFPSPLLIRLFFSTLWSLILVCLTNHNLDHFHTSVDAICLFLYFSVLVALQHHLAVVSSSDAPQTITVFFDLSVYLQRLTYPSHPNWITEFPLFYDCVSLVSAMSSHGRSSQSTDHHRRPNNQQNLPESHFHLDSSVSLGPGTSQPSDQSLRNCDMNNLVREDFNQDDPTFMLFQTARELEFLNSPNRFNLAQITPPPQPSPARMGTYQDLNSIAGTPSQALQQLQNPHQIHQYQYHDHDQNNLQHNSYLRSHQHSQSIQSAYSMSQPLRLTMQQNGSMPVSKQRQQPQSAPVSIPLPPPPPQLPNQSGDMSSSQQQQERFQQLQRIQNRVHQLGCFHPQRNHVRMPQLQQETPMPNQLSNLQAHNVHDSQRPTQRPVPILPAQPTGFRVNNANHQAPQSTTPNAMFRIKSSNSTTLHASQAMASNVAAKSQATVSGAMLRSQGNASEAHHRFDPTASTTPRLPPHSASAAVIKSKSETGPSTSTAQQGQVSQTTHVPASIIPTPQAGQSSVQPAMQDNTTNIIASRKRTSRTKAKMSQPRVSTAEALRLAAQMDRPPTRRSSKGGWTDDEDDMLRVVVMEHNEKNWKDIAKALNNAFPKSNRNDVQCLHRWQKVLQPGLKKGPWTSQEDETITRLVKELGANRWSIIAKELPGRIGKQCRERWFNHLNPEINKAPWTEEEERILQEAHNRIGNRWAIISRYLPGRTDNAIKNHFNATKRRAATRKGRKAKERATPDTIQSDPNLSATHTAAESIGLADATQPGNSQSQANPVSSHLTITTQQQALADSATADDAIVGVKDQQENKLTNDSSFSMNPLADVTNTIGSSDIAASSNPLPHKKRMTSPLSSKPAAKRSKSSSAISDVNDENSNRHSASRRENTSGTHGTGISSSHHLVDDIDGDVSYLQPLDMIETPKSHSRGAMSAPRQRTLPPLLSRFLPRNSNETSRKFETSSKQEGTAPDSTIQQADKALPHNVNVRGDETLQTPVKVKSVVKGNDGSEKPNTKESGSHEKCNSMQQENNSKRGDENGRGERTTYDLVEGSLMPFSTPPRGLFSASREDLGGLGSVGQDSPGFLLRADETPRGTLGMTPAVPSPHFLNTSPRDTNGRRMLTGSALHGRDPGAISSLLTPGGLFGNTPGMRGRLGALTDGLGGGFGITPTKSNARDTLLPPMFSPPPGMTPNCQITVTDLKAQGDGSKTRLYDSELRLPPTGFTPGGDLMSDGRSGREGLLGDAWTKRQLFNCGTPQPSRAKAAEEKRSGETGGVKPRDYVADCNAVVDLNDKDLDTNKANNEMPNEKGNNTNDGEEGRTSGKDIQDTKKDSNIDQAKGGRDCKIQDNEDSKNLANAEHLHNQVNLTVTSSGDTGR